MLLVAVLLLAGCRNLFTRNSAKPRPHQNQQGNTASTFTCPIDGQPVSSELMYQRPLAVMIENSPAARPQSGLNDACVVYEAITEGGITRFLAIYVHGAPEVIGPVRSARPHFINLAREYDAAFTHCGQSQEALEMLVSTPSIYNLDEMKYSKPFWRDRSRRAPHNLYSSAEKLRAQVQKLNWGSAPSVLPDFTSDLKPLKDGQAADKIVINFRGGVKYGLRFQYDKARGGYVRYMDGKLHVDRETGEPIVAKNVLVQRVSAAQFAESKHKTYDVTVTGSGTGTFISNGYQTPMQWQKNWDGGITSYTDDRGMPLPFQPGQTWVEVLPMEGTVSISGPPAPAR
ncbi:MAG: DUF3048 domain-containing protein [Armatimonadota bacterium]